MAPSPTGFFHVGSARTALYNWLFARHHDGKFVLRVEDTDPKRSSPDMINAILDGMKWLGLDWDEEYYQSKRFDLYRKYVQNLIDRGKAYYCYCDPEKLEIERKDAYKEKINWQYDRRCLNLSRAEKELKEKEGAPKAVRFAVPQGMVKYNDTIHGEISREASDIEDFVILRPDQSPTYNLACVVDDADMKISHVIRAVDHITNTPKQILLYQALELPVPHFAHLPLILGRDKSKLSKRHGAVSIMEYRDQGFLPEAVFNYLALLGWSPGDNKEIMDRNDLIARFTLDRVNASNAVFDLEKLEWMNQQHIITMNKDKLTKLIVPVLVREKILPPGSEIDEKCLRSIIDLMRPRLKVLNDIKNAKYLFNDQIDYSEKSTHKHFNRETADLLSDYLVVLRNAASFDKTIMEEQLRDFADKKRLKAGDIIHPLRAYVTGQDRGPGLFETMEYLGKEKCIARIERAIRKVIENA